MNKLDFYLFLSFLLFNLPIVNAQSNCAYYCPCEVGTLEYVSNRLHDKVVFITYETIKITTANAHNVGFQRSVRSTIFGSGKPKNINYPPRSGDITIDTDGTANYPGAFFVPGSPNGVIFSNLTTTENFGNGCNIPSEPTNQNLVNCNQMGMEVTLTIPSDKDWLSGKQTSKWNVSYVDRTVLDSTNASIVLRGETVDAVIIAEKAIYEGLLTGSCWEVSWLVKGYGKVRTNFYENLPDKNDLHEVYDRGYRGFRILVQN